MSPSLVNDLIAIFLASLSRFLSKFRRKSLVNDVLAVFLASPQQNLMFCVRVFWKSEQSSFCVVSMSQKSHRLLKIKRFLFFGKICDKNNRSRLFFIVEQNQIHRWNREVIANRLKFRFVPLFVQLFCQRLANVV